VAFTSLPALVQHLTELGFFGDAPTTPPSAFDVLDFLSAEAQATRMLRRRHAAEGLEETSEGERCVALVAEIRQLLGAPPAPAGANLSSSLGEIEGTVRERLGKIPDGALGKHIVEEGSLDDDQMACLTEINEHFQGDYKLRRRMLLQRLDVLVTSFQWSAKVSPSFHAYR
jgi:protein FAM98B